MSFFVINLLRKINKMWAKIYKHKLLNNINSQADMILSIISMQDSLLYILEGGADVSSTFWQS